MTGPRPPAPCARVAAARILAALLASGTVLGAGGCGGQAADAQPGSALLTRADLGPLDPEMVEGTRDLPRGSQYWACSDNTGVLRDHGWHSRGRALLGEDWTVYSVVYDNADGSATDQLARLRRQVASCPSADQRLPVVEDLTGDHSFGFRSVTPRGRVDTVTGFAIAGDHRLVQVSVLGLHGHDAPDQLKLLLQKAVDRAS